MNADTLPELPVTPAQAPTVIEIVHREEGWAQDRLLVATSLGYVVARVGGPELGLDGHRQVILQAGKRASITGALPTTWDGVRSRGEILNLQVGACSLGVAYRTPVTEFLPLETSQITCAQACPQEVIAELQEVLEVVHRVVVGAALTHRELQEARELERAREEARVAHLAAAALQMVEVEIAPEDTESVEER